MTVKYTFSENYGDVSFVEAIVDSYHKGRKDFKVTTSGTTGTPKEITLNESLLKWSCAQTRFALGLKNKENILCALPVQKTGGFMQLMRALCFDWYIHFINPSSNPLAEIPADHKFTTVSLSPLQLFECIENEPKKLNRFKVVLIGGGPVSARLEAKIAEFQKKHSKVVLYETYGMTETASHVALRNLSQGHEYFKPQMGVTLYTDDSDRIIIEIHELGLEIETEDIGLISFFGFRVLGRADEIINSGGIKIHPGSVELQTGPLLEKAGIDRNFYISKMKDDKLGDAMVLVLEGDGIKDEKFLLELLKRELPKHHSPREIKYEAEFERTDTGKVVRKTY